MKQRNVFDNMSALDYRYWDKGTASFLSERAFTKYKLKVELALVKALHRYGLCSKDIVDAVEAACSYVTTHDVYNEEDRVKHDIRALVNCIQAMVSDKAKPFVHMTATSFDIVDTANAVRYKEILNSGIIPSLMKLEKVLIKITLRESDTLQIGRTHGQHAVPITFGFAMAEYVHRLGNCILSLKRLTKGLKGKFSGAVGAYNASSLFFDKPEEFERQVLAEMGLEPAGYSSQIVPPEPIIRLFSELVLIAGVLANLARDMRNLQRTEIGEVGEEFGGEQVGSSTMPQKRNPINFENIESQWKVLVGRMMTVSLDQISEHQRDLTGSASGRTYPEIMAYLVSMIKRMTKVMKKLKVDKQNFERNFKMQEGLIIAEPLYIILAALGHPNAHEKVRKLTLRAQSEGRPLQNLAWQDNELQSYLEKMSEKQRDILGNPRLYTGIAAKKAVSTATTWAKLLRIELERSD